jgi:hypothetical protein
LLLLIPFVLALIVSPAALGGGFATVGLSSTPTGVSPGQPWNVDITVLAHGRTPVEGAPAVVRIRSGDAVKEFPTTETSKPGVYRASVVFPAAGVWDYEVVDGYTQQVHAFPAVDVAGEPVSAVVQAPDTGDGIAAGWLWGAGAALLLALAVLAFDRRRRHPARSLKTA